MSKKIEQQKISKSNFEANLKFLKSTGKLKKGLKILEISSGYGVLLNELLKKGYDAIGTEYSVERINEAKKLFPGMKIKRMGGEKITFPDNKFDLVISFDVVEHIPNAKKHFSEVKRVLKKGGHYIFCTPNMLTNVPWEIIDKRSLSKWKEYHVSLFTYWGLKKSLVSAGLTPTFRKTSVVNEFFLAKIKRNFGNLGVFLIKIFNPDLLPIPLRTNFYVIAKNV